MRKQKNKIRLMWTALMKKPQGDKKSIHEQLAETIAERKDLLAQWEKIFQPKPEITVKSIHDQLQETIAKLRKEKQWFGERLSAGISFNPGNKRAA